MGATATRQAGQVLEHTETIVAIELLLAAQGVDFRRQDLGQTVRLGQGTAVVYDLVRQAVPFVDHDVALAPYIETVRQLVNAGIIKEAVEAAVAAL